MDWNEKMVYEPTHRLVGGISRVGRRKVTTMRRGNMEEKRVVVRWRVGMEGIVFMDMGRLGDWEVGGRSAAGASSTSPRRRRIT